MFASCSKNPLNCRVNEFDRKALMKRYVGFIQDMANVSPAMQAELKRLAATNEAVMLAKGHMKVSPDSQLTENEDRLIRTSVVRVLGAGTEEVNGEYTFSRMLCHVGCYVKPGTFQGKDVEFTLYKCNVQNGMYQWFISIAPEGRDLGTNDDTDFYYAPCRLDAKNEMSLYMPPLVWSLSSNKVPVVAQPPAPRIEFVTKPLKGMTQTVRYRETGNVPSSSSAHENQQPSLEKIASPTNKNSRPQHGQTRVRQQNNNIYNDDDVLDDSLLENGRDVDVDNVDSSLLNTSLNSTNNDDSQTSITLPYNTHHHILGQGLRGVGGHDRYSDSDMEMNTADDDDDDDDDEYEGFGLP
jgi:hypothetical protein